MVTKSFQRIDRIAQLLKRELASALFREEKDLGLKFVTISYVEVSKDLSLARVYITLLEDDPVVIKKTLAILNEHKAYFRHYLATNTNLRTAPQVTFYFDETVQYARHINRLIKDADIKDDEALD
jgi:ribosome-binding factor A